MPLLQIQSTNSECESTFSRNSQYRTRTIFFSDYTHFSLFGAAHESLFVGHPWYSIYTKYIFFFSTRYTKNITILSNKIFIKRNSMLQTLNIIKYAIFYKTKTL